MSAARLSTTSTGPSARTALTAAVVLVFVLWTLAAVFTLVYWSGTVLWVLGAIALVGFIWILKVYLRPRTTPEDT